MNQAQKKKVIKPLYTHWKKMPNEVLRAVLLDFKRWCAEGKLIINKQGHAVPFILNEAQEKVAELILSKAFARIDELSQLKEVDSGLQPELVFQNIMKQLIPSLILILQMVLVLTAFSR